MALSVDHTLTAVARDAAGNAVASDMFGNTSSSTPIPAYK